MKQKQVQFHLTAREFTAFSDMTALFQLKNHRIASSRLKNTLFLISFIENNHLQRISQVYSYSYTHFIFPAVVKPGSLFFIGC